MPNYTLVANSTFQPFTYQELMMPIERQNQYFEKLAEEYDKMSSQADVLEAMGSSDLDKGSNTYNRYKAYSDNLRKERDNLFANGLNFESRQRLSDLRRMYNTEIVPIQNAWQKREQEAQLQMKARMDAAARGIDIRFSRDAANSSLDSYMQNPNQTFQVINGQQITNEVANQFKGLASQVQSDGNGNYFIKGKPLSQIEYSIITQKGMDWNHYQDFINNPNDSRFANIKGIIENTLNAHGIKNFDENTYRDMFAYGAQGVAAGVGARDVQLHTDAYAQDMLNFNQQVALKNMDYQNDLALARAKGEIGNGGEDDETALLELFNNQSGTLPIAPADKNIDKEILSNAEAFGWRKESKNPKGYYPGKMSIGFSGNGYAQTVQVDLFNDNGKVKTWKQFSKDLEDAMPKATTTQKKAALQRAQKKFVDAVNTAKSLGLDPTKGYTRTDVDNALKLKKDSGGAGYINGYHWNHKNSDWNPTAQNMNVREIKKKGHDGKFTFDSTPYTLGDILASGKDAKVNTTGQDAGAFITVQDGQEGVVFTVGKRQFFMSAEAMSKTNYNGAYAFGKLKEANAAVKQAEKLQKTDPNEAYTLMIEAASKTQDALSKLEVGFVVNDSNPTQNKFIDPTATQKRLFKQQ